MFGCSIQKYGYWPCSVKVKLNVCPGFSNGVKFGEELNLLSGCPLLPDVTVCGCESLFVHVTVSPTCTVAGFGLNAVLVWVEAPETMVTLVPLVVAVAPPLV